MSRSSQQVRWPTGEWLLPGEVPAHVRCGECSHCTTGVGRSRDPEATDCWADYLDALLPVQKESA